MLGTLKCLLYAALGPPHWTDTDSQFLSAVQGRSGWKGSCAGSHSVSPPPPQRVHLPLLYHLYAGMQLHFQYKWQPRNNQSLHLHVNSPCSTPKPPVRWCVPPRWRHTWRSAAPRFESWVEHSGYPVLKHAEERGCFLMHICSYANLQYITVCSRTLCLRPGMHVGLQGD